MSIEEDEKLLLQQRIPPAELLSDVEAFLRKEGNITPEEGVKRIEIMYKRYKRMEQQLSAQKLRLSSKLPDLKESIDVVDYLEKKAAKKEGLEMTHVLNVHVYQRVVTDTPEKVLLWLGSNVMVEFGLEEAREILQNNYKIASDAVAKIDEELAYIKDQVTTTEVNVAHVYNYGVRQRTKKSK